MKKITIIAILGVFALSCSKDNDKNDCDCQGLFVNLETGETMNQPTDCDRTPPAGYAFVECITPDY